MFKCLYLLIFLYHLFDTGTAAVRNIRVVESAPTYQVVQWTVSLNRKRDIRFYEVNYEVSWQHYIELFLCHNKN